MANKQLAGEASSRKNGWQIADENVQKLNAWIRLRQEANDWKNYIRGGKLNRSEIARECVFGTSVFSQNPVVKSVLSDLEDTLRKENILPPLISEAELPPAAPVTVDSEDNEKETKVVVRLKRKIQELEIQLAEKSAKIRAYEETLKRNELFDKHLRDTGRLIRK